jgi:putative ABC transport system ATP-binding protein
MYTHSQQINAPLVIEADNLTKVYPMGSVAVHALRGVSLRVRKGEFLALMGASGSGKSTLMHLLGCLDSPTSGTYCLEGRDVSSISDDARAFVRNRRVGFIFQSFNLLPGLSALENVILPLMYRGNGRQAKDRGREALQRVGLSTRLHHRPMEMSGGERQRVAIARAMISNPVLILADEPTGNLDSATGEAILNLLAEMHAEGRTILMVTHNEQAACYAERVVVMQDGLIVNQRGRNDRL